MKAELDARGLITSAEKRLDGCRRSLARTDLSEHEIENEFIAASHAINLISRACLSAIGHRGEKPEAPLAITVITLEAGRRGIAFRRDLASDLKWINRTRNGSVHDGAVEEVSDADARDALAYATEYLAIGWRIVG